MSHTVCQSFVTASTDIIVVRKSTLKISLQMMIVVSRVSRRVNRYLGLALQVRVLRLSNIRKYVFKLSI